MPDLMTRRVVVQLGLAIAVLLVVGVLAGLVWQWIWTPTPGIVQDHQWYPTDAIALQHEFSGTGWYVVVGLLAGAVAGVVAALVSDRLPLVTLAVVVVGSVLGAWVMLQVGSALSPPDPQTLAKTADDGTLLPGELSVSGHSPWVAYPFGALVGLAVVYVGIQPGSRHKVETPG